MLNFYHFYSKLILYILRKKKVPKGFTLLSEYGSLNVFNY